MRMGRMHIFGIGLLYTVQNAALSFFASPFLLEIGISESTVGLLFAGASLCGLAVLSLFPLLIQYCGARCLFVHGGTLLTVSLFALATSPGVIVSLAFLLIALLASLLLWSVFDIGLEYTTTNENETGRTRSIFLTTVNAGFVAVPSIAGFLVTTGGFSTLFVALGISTGISTLYGWYAFPHVPRTPQNTLRMAEILDVLVTQPNIRRVFSAQFMLQAFYTFMVVYMPIMLVSTYGLSLQEMSIVFSIAMLAFLIVEPPVGFISDTWLGEKEIMIAGFVILVLSTAALPLLAGASLTAWAALMFTTRVGAASIEITTESYFFKHVNSTNLVQVSAYRMLSALARLVVPLLATFFLTYFSITALPVAIAVCIAIVAIIELPRLQDTR